MQIEMIAPVSTASAALPRLGLGMLAALTPPEDEIIYTDEVVEAFDLERDVKDVGLVAISVDSKTARRSYDIAAAYRRRGVPVVLGGIHPTACPDEAMQHADAIVVGEADRIWPTVVEDAKRRELKPIYKPPLPDLGGLPLPRRSIFKKSRRYVPFEITQTMRGCPYPCEFCSVSTANGTTMRFRPADDVLSELGGMGKLVMFADDNVMIHRGYSRDLFTRMAPLGKHWIGQCSLAAIRRIENVQLMAASGCKALFVGFESVDEETTRFTGKKQNRPSEYKETIAMLHEHGISVWGSFVFGFDTDDPEVFDRTADFAVEMKLTAASFAMLCPYPGTALYKRLAAENRLPDPAWWLREYHDEDGPHFVPKQFSSDRLREGWMHAAERFYSWNSMWRRYTTGPQFGWIQRWAYWPLNVMQRRLAQRRVGATRRLDLSC
jgi:radical SAM superfamily enzyme YgiQ (UPF0313 family)